MIRRNNSEDKYLEMYTGIICEKIGKIWRNKKRIKIGNVLDGNLLNLWM